jgi:hypothetical protein
MVMISICPRGPAWRFATIACALITAIVASTKSVGAQRAGEEIKRFELRIENNRLRDGNKTIRLKGGDVVEITWYADRPAVVHLHGYDIEITVDAERPQIMSFKAHATGRFAIELHGGPGTGGPRDTVLTYLEVHPR